MSPWKENATALVCFPAWMTVQWRAESRYERSRKRQD